MCFSYQSTFSIENSRNTPHTHAQVGLSNWQHTRKGDVYPKGEDGSSLIIMAENYVHLRSFPGSRRL